MAVTVEGTPSIGTAVASVTSITFSHTTGGTATGLFVGAGHGVVTPATTTGVTHNGDAMTELWDVAGGLDTQSAGYLRVSPDIGTYNIVVTWSAAVAAGNAGGVGLAGLETSSVAAAHRTVYTNTDTGGTIPEPTVTVVDSVNGDLVIDTACTYGSAIAVGTGQTSRFEDDDIAGNFCSMGGSTESATGASTVMSWTTTTDDYWAIGATALVAAAAGGDTLMAQICL